MQSSRPPTFSAPATHAALLLFGLVASSVLASGCSKAPDYPEATVIGTVTIDGAPVPHGAITFKPQAGGQGPVTGTAIENGQFRCEHVPLGNHTVTFTAQAAELRNFTDATGVPREVPQDILPARYNLGLSVEVAAGENTHDFPLTRKP